MSNHALYIPPNGETQYRSFNGTKYSLRIAANSVGYTCDHVPVPHYCGITLEWKKRELLPLSVATYNAATNSIQYTDHPTEKGWYWTVIETRYFPCPTGGEALSIWEEWPEQEMLSFATEVML